MLCTKRPVTRILPADVIQPFCRNTISAYKLSFLLYPALRYSASDFQNPRAEMGMSHENAMLFPSFCLFTFTL